MKSFKKLLAVVLSLAMVLGTVTVTAVAGEVTDINNATELSNALEKGGEYRLTADIISTTKDFVKVETEKNVTIDLNGHKLARSSNGSFAIVSGTLTIKDTATGGIFGSTATGTTTTDTLMTVSGTFNLESGTLQGQKSSALSAKLIYNTGTFNMSGGTITKLAITSTGTSAMAIDNSGRFNMTGGTITGNDVSAASRRVLQNNNSNAVMNLSGGEITDNKLDDGSDVFIYRGTANISGSMMIKGVISYAKDYSTLNITGGYFKNKVYTPANGYVCDELTDTEKSEYSGYNYKVVPALASIYNGQTLVKAYSTFDAALAAATNGQTVKLVADCSSSTRYEKKNAGEITIDLNGKTLTCANTAEATTARLANVNSGTTLIIDDSSNDELGTIVAATNITNNGAILYCNGGTAIVKNGKFKDNGKESSDFAVNSGTMKIYGGYFTSKSSTNVDNYATGSDETKAYRLASDSTYTDFPYKIVESDAVAKVNDRNYESFDSAIAAAGNGDTVTLLADCAKTTAVTEIPSGTTITLDLNGQALKNTYKSENAEDEGHKYFVVKGTLNIEDSSNEKTGSITVNSEYTGKAGITHSDGGTVNVTGGNFFNGEAQGESTNNCWMNKNGGTHVISGGWFTKWARPTNIISYVSEGASVIQVTDADKATTPYTISDSTKTIKYDTQGGTFDELENLTYYYKNGYSTEVAITDIVGTKSGYTFVGWSTDPNATSESENLIESGDKVNFADIEKFGTEDTITLYAIWSINTYNIKYNNVPEDAAQPTIVTFNILNEITLEKITRPNWVFKNWTEGEIGGTVITGWNAGEKTADVEVYANWEEAEASVTVGENTTYYESYDEAIAAAVLETEATVTLLKNCEKTTVSTTIPSGKTITLDFNGCTLTNTHNGTDHALKTFVVDAGATLNVKDSSKNGTGKFCASEEFSDVYYSGDFAYVKAGSDTHGTLNISGGNFYKGRNKSGSLIYKETSSGTSKGEIYVTGGFWENAVDSGNIANGYASVKVEDAAKSDTPYTVSNTSKTITYDANGGENAPADQTYYWKEGYTTKLAISSQACTKTGYTFKGWSTVQEPGKDDTIYSSGASVDFSTFDGATVTLYAQYTAVEYTITYTNVPEGVVNTNPTTYTVEEPVALTALADCHFKNWAIEGESTEGWAAGKMTGDVTIDAEFYAQHTITYENTKKIPAPSKTSFYEDENVILESIANREAYYFNGWHLNSNTGTLITGWNAGEKTADVTVYAGWSTPDASVTINSTTTLYPDFADAIAAVKESASEATLKLFKDITVTARVDLGTQADLTLDLNGKTLTETTDTTSGIIIFGGVLTIKDSSSGGTMVDATSKELKSIVCERKDAKLTIESGIFEGFICVTSNASGSNKGAGSTLTGGTYNFDPSTDKAATIDTANYQICVREATEEVAASWTIYEAAAQVIKTVEEVETTTGYRYVKSSTQAQSAIDNVKNGDTLKLLKDTSATKEFSEKITFTVNKNGCEWDIDTKLTAGSGYKITIDTVEGEADVYTVTVDTLKWNITYNYGDGKAPAEANPSQVVRISDEVIPLNNPTPANGYEFTGYKNQDGDTVDSLQGTTITKDLILTAQYEAISYKITYEGVVEGSTNDNVETYTVTDAVTLKDATSTETKQFVKWQINGEDTKGWNAGQTGDVTVTAVYTDIYTITYDLNCGSETTVSTDNVTTYTALDTVTLNDAQGTREKYTFSKWVLVDEQGEEGTTVTGWVPGEMTGNLTIKAKWNTGAASVTIGESTIAYKTFAEAVAAVKNCEPAATLKLLKDVTTEARVDLGTQTDLTLDLNGKTITETTATTGSGLFIYSGALTITGEGEMVDSTDKTSGNRSIVCQRDDATLTIENGTFEGFKKSTTNADKDNPGAGATIKAGTFSFNPLAEAGGRMFTVADGVYTVTDTLAGAYITTSKGVVTSYEYVKSSTLAKSALDNVENDDTITLYKDTNASKEFSEEITFTVDKNGCTWDLNTKLTAADFYDITFTLVEGKTDVYTVAVVDDYDATVTHDGNVTKYSTIKGAYDAVQEGDTVTVAREVSEDMYTFAKVINFTVVVEEGVSYDPTNKIGYDTYYDIKFTPNENGTLVSVFDSYEADVTISGNTTKYLAMQAALDAVTAGATLSVLNGEDAAVRVFDSEISFTLDLTRNTTWNYKEALAAGDFYKITFVETSEGSNVYTVTVADDYAADYTDPDSATVKVKTMKEALDLVVANVGGTITLQQDATESYNFENAVTFAIKLNGHTYDYATKLTAAQYYKVNSSVESGIVTISVVDDYAASVDTGKILTKYDSLTAALTAVADNNVLTLMKDATDTFTFPEEEKVFTFDKNGKNYDFGNLKAPDGYVLHVIDNKNDTFQIGIDKIEDVEIKKDGITLAGTLSDTLGMKFYVEYYLPKGADVPVFVFTNPMTGEDETIEGVATDIYGKYSYEIKGIYVNYIADVFGWSIMDGKKELVSSTASILGYYEELAKIVTDETTLTLIDNTIKYGYELQKYGKKGAEFNISKLGDWATAHAIDIDPPEEKTMGRGGAMKTCFTSISLHVTDKIAMVFNMENVPAGYKVALYDKYGQVVQLKGKDDNYYYKLEVGEKTLSKWSVVSASISPDEYGDTFALELFDTEGKLVGWAVYKVNTYCFNMKDATEGKNPVGGVARAIYNYGTAFVAYQKAH